MARTKEFDPGHAVDAAMRTFWKRGYAATSAQDLCDATGLGRSSIYNAFDGKHDLYLRALRRYSGAADWHTRIRDGEGSIRERVRAVLMEVVNEETGPRGMGCFVVNAGIEMADSDPEVAAILVESREAIVATLHDAFRVAQAGGDISRHQDPLALARFVQATVSALRVMGRSSADRRAMTDVAEVAVSAL